LRVPPGSRRRAVLTAALERGHVTLGYHRRRSHDLFAVEECVVLAPVIVAALPGMRAVAVALGRRESRLTVLATPAGLDVAADGGPARLDAKTAAALAALAARHRIARISLNGEPIVEQARPALALSGAAVVPPPAAFVQAVAEAETAMVQQVLAAVGKAKRTADMFAGVGTFTFALAPHARVLSLDGDAKALAALADGARHASGLKPIETKVRDLFREPLSPKELEAFDAVVLDPPRAGARAQAESLARSKVKRVVYVSCNPGTLARDARILVDGGYRLERVTPIDQFLFSAHVEAVAIFARR
jgi:23S rRNA (uracil1939-C5)-methyltransferase